MRNSHPFVSDLGIADNVITEIAGNQLVILRVQKLCRQRLALFAKLVDILFKFRKHRLAVERTLVGLHDLVEDIELFFITLRSVQLAMHEQQFVNGGSNLRNENGVTRVVRLIVMRGEPCVHGVSRLVCKRTDVIERARIVHKNIGFRGRTARAEGTASLAAARIYVYPTLFRKALTQSVVIFVAVNLYGFENFFNCLLIRILSVQFSDQRSVNVVKMKLLESKNLLLQRIVIVKNGKRAVDGVDQVVIDLGSDLVLKGGGRQRVLEILNLGKRRVFLDHRVHHCTEGVAELLVGLVKSGERRLANLAVAAHQIACIACVRQLNAGTGLILDLAEAHIGIDENIANLVGSADAVFHLRHQLFAFVGKRMIFSAHGLFDHTAEGHELFVFGKPAFHRLLGNTEHVGLNEPGYRACGDRKIANLCIERLVRVIGSLNREIQGSVMEELIDQRLDIRQTFQGVIEILRAVAHRLLIFTERLDRLFRLGVISVKIRFGRIDRRKIPFIAGLNIFSFFGHFQYLRFYRLVIRFVYLNKSNSKFSSDTQRSRRNFAALVVSNARGSNVKESGMQE